MSDDDSLTIAYMSGFADGKNSELKKVKGLEQRITELEKELFMLASDVIYYEFDNVPDNVIDKAKAIYDRLTNKEAGE